MKVSRLALVALAIFGGFKIQAQHAPNPSDIKQWYLHPNKSRQLPECPIPLDSTGEADVFFIHATTYFNGIRPNARITRQSNQRRILATLINDATAFQHVGRLYAPAYRQVKLKVFLKGDPARQIQALDLAYEDIKNAFAYFIDHWNEGRPIVIAAHGQGSLLAQKLIYEFFDGGENNRLVVAYLPGYPVSTQLMDSIMTKIHYCADSTDISCLIGWETYGKFAGFGEKINFIQYGSGGFEPMPNPQAYCTNPLTWSPLSDSLSPLQNTIALRPSNNFKIPLKTMSYNGQAIIRDGRLIVYGQNKYLFNATGDNLFKYDYNLFYANIRYNALARVSVYRNR